MKKSKVFAIALVAGAAALASISAQASCYIVRNAKGQIISESPNPPVDMSLPLHDTVPRKFGAGATMSFGVADPDCGKEIDTWDKSSSASAPRAKAGKKRTARRSTAVRGKRSARRTAGSVPVTPAKGGGIRTKVERIEQPAQPAATSAPASE